jgi:hypothetical protein
MRPVALLLIMWATLAALALLLMVVGPAWAAAPPTGEAGVAISTAPEGTVAGSVDAGEFHSCGVKTDATLACWGSNSNGQLNGIPSGTFTSVSAGVFHSCGVKTDGTLACWGDNDFGQLNGIPSGTFTSVSAGGFHSCGVKADGTLACWGDNFNGQLNAPSGTFTSVSAGDFYSCGVKTDATLACWGDNTFGQLNGIPSGTFTSVSAYHVHSCGVKTDGTLACWGDNSNGQLNAPSGTFTSVSAGHLHSCGVKTDATLACWGNNDFGQLNGIPSGTFTSVSAGGFHSCGVKTDGTLACWGRNVEGQLGAAPEEPSPDPPAGQVGTEYSHSFTSSTGSPSGTFAVSNTADLPPGLNLSSSGVLSGTPTSGGDYTFTVTASNGLFTDATKQFTLTIVFSDTTAPTTTIALDPATPNGDNLWYKSAVKLTVSATDDTGGSGVAETRCVLDPTSEPTSFDELPSGTCPYLGSGANVSADGEHTLWAASKDEAGKEESPVSKSFKIDATAPMVTCDVASPGPTFVLGGSGGNVTATVTDATSGPVSESLSDAADVESVGNKSVSLTGSDNAGNTTPQSCPYTVKYNFLGFLSPIPQLSYKVGSTIPVKFMLADAAGTRILDRDAQALASQCKVEVLFSGGTPANNCASYNATTDTFQFNLKIPKRLASGDYTISVEVSAPDDSGVVNKEPPVQVNIRR